MNYPFLPPEVMKIINLDFTKYEGFYKEEELD
jgi:hypothetical protein